MAYSFSSKKVIVIGGAGFIGTNVCLSAFDRGLSVALFDNFSRPGTDLNLAILQERGGEQLSVTRGDTRSQNDLQSFFAQHADADAVFQLAGQVAVTTSVTDPRLDFDCNLLGTFNVLEAMRANAMHAPVIYASTNKVYGGMEGIEIVEQNGKYAFRDYPEGIAETFPLDFHSPYGCSKGGADQYMRDYARIYGLNTIVFRQSCIYGYYQFGIEDQGWVAWFTIAALFDKPITIYGDGKQVRDVLFIDDLVNAYWQAIERSDVTAGQVYNIGGGSFQMSLLELIAHLETFLGKSIHLDFAAPRAGDQKVFTSQIDKAAREFNWTPKVSVEDGVRKLAEWATQNKALFRKAGII